MTPQEMVREFHRYFGVYEGSLPTVDNEELALFRQDLIEEEFTELTAALWNHDLVETTDALADLVYVIYGAAITFGIDLDAALEEVHRSNMTKERSGNYSNPNQPHKVVKGPNYSPPDFTNILND